jgi:hypothetical protein
MRFKITITHHIGTVEATDTMKTEATTFAEATSSAHYRIANLQGVTALSIKPMADRKAYMRGYMQRKRAKPQVDSDPYGPSTMDDEAHREG